MRPPFFISYCYYLCYYHHNPVWCFVLSVSATATATATAEAAPASASAFELESEAKAASCACPSNLEPITHPRPEVEICTGFPTGLKPNPVAVPLCQTAYSLSSSQDQAVKLCENYSDYCQNVGEASHFPIWNLDLWRTPPAERCSHSWPCPCFHMRYGPAFNGFFDCVNSYSIGKLTFRCAEGPGPDGPPVDCYIPYDYIPADVTTTPVPDGGYVTVSVTTRSFHCLLLQLTYYIYSTH